VPEGDPKVCPYCGRCPTGVGEDIYTDDHIFLDSIGGRRTIRACKRCNDVFGHTFEVHTLELALRPLLVLLWDVGVPVIDRGKWKNAFIGKDGLPYHLTMGPNDLEPEGTQVVVDRNPDNPKVLKVIVNADVATPKLLRKFSNNKKLRLASRVELPAVQHDNVQGTLNIDNEMRLTALKMAFAVATIATPAEVDRFIDARKNLAGSVTDFDLASVRPDHRDHAALDKNRKPLCHTIYVEQSQGIIHGIVQFFGSFQLWIKLSSEPVHESETAMIATLDPISGDEEFREIAPRLDIPICKGDEEVDSTTPVRKFNLGAAWRGARTPETLKLTKIDGVDIPRVKPYSNWS
jgi:HNH endonuclease